MKIAVSSANGKLGSTIIKQLITEVGEDHVIGIARTPEKAAHLGIEIRRGDYNVRSEFDQALVGVDAVLLVSGLDEPHKRIQQHRNVIEAAKRNGVKKIVYTSIIGDEEKNAFKAVVQSNRQTEIDVKNSGMEWVIGRNGIYLEPDLEYIDTYVKEGEIRNCAGEGKCAYTNRTELSIAYTKLLTQENHQGKQYNLVGEAISQTELAKYINHVYSTNLKYHRVSVEAYRAERITELGEFYGTIIAGIYEGIRSGANDLVSDFEKVCGRPHLSTLEMITAFKNNQL